MPRRGINIYWLAKGHLGLMSLCYLPPAARRPFSFLQVMPAIKFILFILLLIVIASFAVQNMVAVGISYYDFEFQLQTIELPLMVEMLIPLLLGFLIAWVMGLSELFKLKSTIRRQNKSISSLEEELESLKNTSQLPAQAESTIDS